MVLLINYDIIFVVRDLFKKIIIGIAFFISPSVIAEEYKVLVVPDNIVTENVAVDSFIYNASAEFFADEIINLLNTTDYIIAPTVSETRVECKQDTSAMLLAKNITNKFRTTYNVDYVSLKRLAQRTNSKYVLLITSYIDSENYILRRTVWDFLNIPGATVVDPAYKISTYAVLVDVDINQKLWADTFYKTISVCENRIITRGMSPQTEQLSKIKDYSHYLCPQIVYNVQQNILPPEIMKKETKQIDYDLSNFDNEFTKKYRYFSKEYDRIYQRRKADVKEFADESKTLILETADKIKKSHLDWKARKKQEKLDSKLEVKAMPVIPEDLELNKINTKSINEENSLKKSVLMKSNKNTINSELIEIEINKKKKNNLIDDYKIVQPELRSYN